MDFAEVVYIRTANRSGRAHFVSAGRHAMYEAVAKKHPALAEVFEGNGCAGTGGSAEALTRLRAPEGSFGYGDTLLIPVTRNPPLRDALAERIRFYNELGIYDFYQRGINAPPEVLVSSDPNLMPRPKAAAVRSTEEDAFARSAAESKTAIP